MTSIRLECVTIFRHVMVRENWDEDEDEDECHQRQKLEEVLEDFGLPMHFKWAFVHNDDFAVEWHTKETAEEAFDAVHELLPDSVSALDRGFMCEDVSVISNNRYRVGFAGSRAPPSTGVSPSRPPSTGTTSHAPIPPSRTNTISSSQHCTNVVIGTSSTANPQEDPWADVDCTAPSRDAQLPDYEGELQTTLFELPIQPGAQIFVFEFTSRGDRGARPATEATVRTLLNDLVASGELLLPRPCVKGSTVYHCQPLPLNENERRVISTKSGTKFEVWISSSKVLPLEPQEVKRRGLQLLQECEHAMNLIAQDQIGQLYYRLGNTFLRHSRKTADEEPGRKRLPPLQITQDGCEIHRALHTEVVMKVVKGKPVWTINLNPARRVFTVKSIDEMIREHRRDLGRFVEDRLKDRDIITRYNPQLYVMEDVLRTETGFQRGRDPLQKLPEYTGESYLVEKYGYEPGTLVDSYMISARQVKGRFHDKIELVASECVLSVGKEHTKYTQYCAIRCNDRMEECRKAANELRAFFYDHDHILLRLASLGSQIVVPYYTLEDPEIKIRGVRDVFSGTSKWGGETRNIRYSNIRFGKVYCVFDDDSGKAFLIQDFLPDFKSKLEKAECRGFSGAVSLIAKKDFLRLPSLASDHLVLHLVNDTSSGSYQLVKAKADAVGATAQSMSREKLEASLSPGQRGPYISNIMKQFLLKQGHLPWTIKLDRKFRHFRQLIMIGIDAYHPKRHFTRGVEDTDPSVMALVGWLMTRTQDGGLEWKSACDFHFLDSRREILDPERNLLGKFCADLKSKWKAELASSGLDGVIVYRDGVGRSQFEAVEAEELLQVDRAFGPDFVTFIIVQKRITFACGLAHTFAGEPPQGALIDQLADLSPFGSQSSYSTYYSHPVGSHAPVQHVILRNRLGLDLAALRTLNYHLCFMYPTWAGATKAPFTVQCSHKLSNYIADRLFTPSSPDLPPPPPRPPLPVVADKGKLFYL